MTQWRWERVCIAWGKATQHSVKKKKCSFAYIKHYHYKQHLYKNTKNVCTVHSVLKAMLLVFFKCFRMAFTMRHLYVWLWMWMRRVSRQTLRPKLHITLYFKYVLQLPLQITYCCMQPMHTCQQLGHTNYFLAYYIVREYAIWDASKVLSILIVWANGIVRCVNHKSLLIGCPLLCTFLCSNLEAWLHAEPIRSL